jgi:hypothetical protein
MYYIGAVLIPLMSWYLAKWIQKSYFAEVSKSIKEEVATRTTVEQRFIVYTAFIICFLCMEILWRVMFEFFIAYFDMHDALMQLT